MAKASYPIDPIKQVRRGKARYCRFVDTRQWDELAALFVPKPMIEIQETWVHSAEGWRIARLQLRRTILDHPAVGAIENGRQGRDCSLARSAAHAAPALNDNAEQS